MPVTLGHSKLPTQNNFFTTLSLEFNTVEEAEPLLSKRGPIKALLVVISAGKDDELTMLEVQNCLNRLEAACGQKLESDKLIWSQIQKAPVGYLHMLVQFKVIQEPLQL